MTIKGSLIYWFVNQNGHWKNLIPNSSMI